MPKKEINLLPKDDLEKKPIGKFLIWALTIGRWIVITVELIVILAFLSRFKLDRDLADLYDSIHIKQKMIQSSASFETDFRQFQSRLTAADTLSKSQLQTDKIISAVAATIPVEVVLTNLSYEDGSIKLTGTSLSENGIKNLTTNFRLSPAFSEINLANVSKLKETEGTIKFTLTAKVKKQG